MPEYEAPLAGQPPLESSIQDAFCRSDVLSTTRDLNSDSSSDVSNKKKTRSCTSNSSQRPPNSPIDDTLDDGLINS